MEESKYLKLILRPWDGTMVSRFQYLLNTTISGGPTNSGLGNDETVKYFSFKKIKPLQSFFNDKYKPEFRCFEKKHRFRWKNSKQQRRALTDSAPSGSLCLSWGPALTLWEPALTLWSRSVWVHIILPFCEDLAFSVTHEHFLSSSSSYMLESFSLNILEECPLLLFQI